MANWGFNELQAENRRWVEHNFGFPGKEHRPVLGMIEELGELTEALPVNGRSKPGWQDDLRDAIADVLIFAADYCNQREWSLDQIVRIDVPGEMTSGGITSLLWNAGRLCHHQLKSEQHIRGSAEEHAEKSRLHMSAVFHILRGVAADYGLAPKADDALLEITMAVWSRVKLRDFRRNASSGQVPCCERDHNSDGNCDVHKAGA